MMGYGLDMDEYVSENKKVFCCKCGFYFFTRYASRIKVRICSSCDGSNKNTKIIRNWES